MRQLFLRNRLKAECLKEARLVSQCKEFFDAEYFAFFYEALHNFSTDAAARHPL